MCIRDRVTESAASDTTMIMNSSKSIYIDLVSTRPTIVGKNINKSTLFIIAPLLKFSLQAFIS